MEEVRSELIIFPFLIALVNWHHHSNGQKNWSHPWLTAVPSILHLPCSCSSLIISNQMLGPTHCSSSCLFPAFSSHSPTSDPRFYFTWFSRNNVKISQCPILTFPNPFLHISYLSQYILSSSTVQKKYTNQLN